MKYFILPLKYIWQLSGVFVFLLPVVWLEARKD